MRETALIKRAYRLLPLPVRAAVYAGKLSLTGGAGDTKKQEVVRSHIKAYGISCFIETGTFEGDMVNAVRPLVKQIYSIELQDYFFNVCYLKFFPYRNVVILKGDSGKILPVLLRNVNERVLFWLDSHYSGGNTASGELETPIMEELRAIKNHTIKSHVILIDDVRLFGEGDYPPIEAVCNFIRSINSQYKIEVEGDILRAHL